MKRFTLKKHSTLDAQEQAFKDMQEQNIPAHLVLKEKLVLNQPVLTIRVGLLGI